MMSLSDKTLTEAQVISHLYWNEDKQVWIIQTNDDHQKGVAELAEKFAKEFKLPSWGRALGLLHDKGKERKAFQQYIRQVNGIQVTNKSHYADHNHAFVGGILAKELMGKNIRELLANQIISHHTGLHDYVDTESILDEMELPEEINKNNINIDLQALAKEFKEAQFFNEEKKLKQFHHLSRMLFSCLVDADRLDTERFMNVGSWKKRKCLHKLADLQPKFEAYMQKLQANASDTKVNKIRKLVQKQCLKMSSKDKGFYSLTVPTGGGKTLSSLLWAMKHAITHNMSRIIIAIPYTSIIMQTAALLKNIFGEENVLEHHSNFNPDNIKDETIREKAQLATENWNYPIIVTTNVQLFESMFSNKPSVCRKLHNIVNSVIILDEVQTLPTDFLQPIVDGLKAYQSMFGISVLFTTASQPVLSGLIEGTNPHVRFNGIDNITEIIPDEYKLHDKLRRVEIKIDKDGRTYDEISAMLTKYNKVLCIVNTRKDAKELYDRLPNEGIKLHLSKMMCPAHISKTIYEIKKLLKDETQPILRVVATQLVEAGVDIDFPIVFRQEAGLDSILQAAGRCNREGIDHIGHTFVFSLSADKRIPYGSIREANNARKNLPNDSDWFSPSVMEMYFKRLYSQKSTFDKNDIKYYLYKYSELCFEKASKAFKLIEDTGVNVIVNWGDSMKYIKKLKESGITYLLMKQLAQFTVNIHQHDFEQLVNYGVIEEILTNIYVLTYSTQYDNATGINLDNHWTEETLTI